MPTRRASGASEGPPLGPVLALMVLAVALAALIGGGKDARDGEADAPVATALPFDGRSPAMPADRSERVLVRLPRPALGELDDPPTGAAARRYVASEHAEGRALRGGLRARGVELDHVVPFGRVYPGFAATVPARDLAQLSSLGVRTDPVRRLYPAAEVVLPARAAPRRTGGATRTTPGLTRSGPRPEVALLDATPALAGLLPARTAWVPEGGADTVPGRLRKETAATSDEVVQGLERAVDPNGDGDPADAVPTALLGLSSPYAGFADGPEARAAGGAARLNTLVVAPAGNEDGPAGAAGGAAAVLTAGAEPAGGLPAVDTTFGPGALLGGRLPAHRIALAKRGPGGRLYDARGRSLVRREALAL